MRQAVRQQVGASIEAANNWSLLNPSKEPRRVAVFRQSPRWVTVFYGSFFVPNLLAAHVSSALQCLVVDTQAQNTSDAYLVTVFDKGARRRELEFAADVGWTRNEGTPLPNEPVPLETAPDDDDGEGWFDQEAVHRYMRTVFDIAWWELPDDGATHAILVG